MPAKCRTHAAAEEDALALAVSTTGWWVIGWVLGVAVVLVAAALLLTIILLARRIVRQAGEIVVALDGARENTTALYDVTQTNMAIERIRRGLHAVRTEAESA